MNDDYPPIMTLEQEREASRQRREARDAETLERYRRLRFAETRAEWSAFRCGKHDPNQWKVAA